MSRALAVVCALALLVTACGSGGEDEAEPSTTIEIPEQVLAVVESVGSPVEFPKKLQQQVMDGVRAYVERGVVPTLRSGKPENLKQLFDAASFDALGTDAGRAMLDRGAPDASGDVTAEAKPLGLVGLADAAGTIVLVAAGLDLEVVADTDDGELTVHRVGDLTFAPVDGAWKIVAFNLAVTRSGAGVEGEAEEAATG